MSNIGSGIIFRADGSHELGLGHIVRTLSLASALKKELGEKADEYTFDFIVRENDSARDVFVDSDFSRNVIWISEDEDEIKFVRNILRELKPRVVVTDIDLTGEADKYLKAIFPGPVHVSLHEHNYGLLSGDRVFAPTVKPLEKAKGATEGLTHFIGADYLILDPEIIEKRRFSEPPHDPVLKVFVSIGGSDPGRNTEKVVAAIKTYNDPTIEWKVILGPASGYDKFELMKKYPAKIGYMEGTELGRGRFLEQLSTADLVITNGATTLYEALAMGRPSIAVAQNEFEAEVVEILSAKGVCRKPEDKTAPGILETMNSFFDSSELRMGCSKAGMELVDGQGANRIAGIILESIL